MECFTCIVIIIKFSISFFLFLVIIRLSFHPFQLFIYRFHFIPAVAFDLCINYAHPNSENGREKEKKTHNCEEKQ